VLESRKVGRKEGKEMINGARKECIKEERR